ncbi:hypothetical protein J2Z21_000580 [Streptomyces griseochromogenes]|uniref:Uncharacterized protein n=1 Tax=Streptomyces griseochromogenes TaxID=68214 RepID=A0ABS4LJU5_9ACTN|nr:hypothetical protein [Streptomyces griseochromogenes]
MIRHPLLAVRPADAGSASTSAVSVPTAVSARP